MPMACLVVGEEEKNWFEDPSLNEIFKEMMHIRSRLDDIENNFSSWKPQPIDVPESELITLPGSLKKNLRCCVF